MLDSCTAAFLLFVASQCPLKLSKMLLCIGPKDFSNSTYYSASRLRTCVLNDAFCFLCLSHTITTIFLRLWLSVVVVTYTTDNRLFRLSRVSTVYLRQPRNSVVGCRLSVLTADRVGCRLWLSVVYVTTTTDSHNRKKMVVIVWSELSSFKQAPLALFTSIFWPLVFFKSQFTLISI